MILTVLKLHSPKGSCNFENCQNHLYLLITNCTRGHAISYTNLEEMQKIFWLLSVWLGANEPQYNWEDITEDFTAAASGMTLTDLALRFGCTNFTFNNYTYLPQQKIGPVYIKLFFIHSFKSLIFSNKLVVASLMSCMSMDTPVTS